MIDYILNARERKMLRRILEFQVRITAWIKMLSLKERTLQDQVVLFCFIGGWTEGRCAKSKQGF